MHKHLVVLLVIFLLGFRCGKAVITDVTNDGLPFVPNITCVVIKWLELNCTWTPSAREQEYQTGLQVEEQLYYNIRHNLPDSDISCLVTGRCTKRKCPYTRDGSCLWRGYDFYKNQEYAMLLKITYTDRHGNGTRNLYGDPQSIDTSDTRLVKVDPPEDFQASTGAWEIELQWNRPLYAISHQLLYSMEVRPTSCPGLPPFNITKVESPWQKSIRMTSMLSGGNYSSIRPYCAYDVTMWSIPHVGGEPRGLWSQPKTIKITTQNDVPGKLPAVRLGFYKCRETDQRRLQSVDVYWNHIPRIYMHGPMQRILVHYVTNPGSELQSCVCPPRSCVHVTYDSDVRVVRLRHIDVDKTYYVYAEGENSQGCNSTLLQSSAQPHLIISKPIDVAMLVDYFAVRRNSSGNYVQFDWGLVRGRSRPVTFTIYWCKVPANGDFSSCKTDIEWEELDGEARTHTRYGIHTTPGEGLAYQFAMSLEYDTVSGRVSSGLLFAECTHDMSRGIARPGISPRLQQHPATIRLSWRKPKRCQDSAYIQQYEIMYWRVAHEAESKMVKVKESKESHVLRDVTVGETYHVQIRSLSPWKQSDFQSLGLFTVTKPAADNAVVPMLLIIVGVIGSLFFFLGVCYTSRRCGKKIKKLKRGPHITLPKESLTAHPNNGKELDGTEPGLLTGLIPQGSSCGMSKEFPHTKTGVKTTNRFLELKLQSDKKDKKVERGTKLGVGERREEREQFIEAPSRLMTDMDASEPDPCEMHAAACAITNYTSVSRAVSPESGPGMHAKCPFHHYEAVLPPPLPGRNLCPQNSDVRTRSPPERNLLKSMTSHSNACTDLASVPSNQAACHSSQNEYLTLIPSSDDENPAASPSNED